MRHTGSYLLLIVLAVSCLSATVGLASVQQRLLEEVFPKQEPDLEWNHTKWGQFEKRATLKLFGIDTALGRSGVLRQFGRPIKAIYAGPERSDFGGTVEGCTYVYPTFQIFFTNKLFSGLEILREDHQFPLGVAVGDTELQVLKAFGPPPFHHATGNWTARYAIGLRNLEIDIRDSRVTKISW